MSEPDFSYYLGTVAEENQESQDDDVVFPEVPEEDEVGGNRDAVEDIFADELPEALHVDTWKTVILKDLVEEIEKSVPIAIERAMQSGDYFEAKYQTVVDRARKEASAQTNNINEFLANVKVAKSLDVSMAGSVSEVTCLQEYKNLLEPKKGAKYYKKTALRRQNLVSDIFNLIYQMPRRNLKRELKICTPNGPIEAQLQLSSPIEKKLEKYIFILQTKFCQESYAPELFIPETKITSTVQNLLEELKNGNQPSDAVIAAVIAKDLAEKNTAAIVKPTPVADDTTTVAADATTVADDATAVPVDATPVAEDATPVAEDATPVAEDATPVAEDATPVAEDATVAGDETPVAEDSTPVAEDATPVAEDATPVAEDATTVTDNATTV